MANQVLYGFHNLQDLFNRRVTEVGVATVNQAVQLSLAEHNRQINALTGLFAFQTTDFKTRFISASSARLQPLDEKGRSRPIKTAGYYDVAFPLQMGGSAWGVDFVTSQKMRVDEVNTTLYTLQMADARWMRDHILAALFTNASWSFSDKLKGTLTVQGLANNDSVVYNIISGADAGATDNHYYAQANAIADGADNPFPTIYDELTEHSENSGEVVVLVPSNQTASIEALANFKEKSDPNIREGANTALLVGNLQAQVPGKVIGYVDKCWIVEWKSLPDNYLIAVTTGGEPPLAMRQDEESSLQGFIQVGDDTRHNFPFYEYQYIRRAGFGGWNRVGALVYRIGNASYAIPTNYTSPMA
jgi:hypothetical protein